MPTEMKMSDVLRELADRLDEDFDRHKDFVIDFLSKIVMENSERVQSERDGMMKIEEEIREILEELLQWYEEIDGNVLDSVPNAFQNITDEIGEKLVHLFKSYARELIFETEVKLKKALLAYQSHDLIRRGINDFKEEMLRRIEEIDNAD